MKLRKFILVIALIIFSINLFAIPSLSLISISSNNTNSSSLAINGNTVTITFTSSEALQNVSVVMFGSGVATVGNVGNNWTATYTLLGAETEGASFTINYQDLLSVAGPEETTTDDATSVTYDRTNPTVAITSLVSNPTNSDPFEVSIIFSETVSGFDVGDITVGGAGGGTADNLQVVVANKEWTADINPSGDGLVTVDIAAGATTGVTDAAGNESTASNTLSRTYDGTAPVFSLTGPTDPSTVNTAKVTYTLSEAIASGTVTFTGTGGSVSTLSGTELNSGAHTDITLNDPPSLTDGETYSISFDGTDAAGNTATTVTQDNITYDNLTDAPTLTIPANSTTDNSPVSVSFNLPEAAKSGTVKLSFLSGSGDHVLTLASGFESSGPHTTTITGTDLINDTDVDAVTGANALVDGRVYSVKIEYEDALGNTANSATNTSFTYDVTPPVFSLTGPTDPSTVNTAKVTYTLSEAIASGTVTFTGTGGSVSTLSGTELNSGAHTDITLNDPPSLTDGETYSISFDGTDAAGNTATTVTQDNITYDNLTDAPTLTIPANSTTDNSPVSVSFNLPEAAKSGTVKLSFLSGSGDHVLTLASGFESSGPHTTTITGTDLINDTDVDAVTGANALVDGRVYSVKIEYEDALGNTANSATNTSFTYDVTPPVFSLTGPTDPSTVNTAKVTYTLSEAIASGTVTFTGTGGSVSTLSGTELNSGAHTDITLNDPPSLTDGETYDISFDGTDAAGNVATTVTNTNITYDVTEPVISSVSPSDNAYINTKVVSYTLSEDIASGTVTFTGTGGPFVSALPGVELSSGAHTNITLVTAPGLVDGAVYSMSIDADDAAGNSAAQVTSTAITYDITPPTKPNVGIAGTTSTPTNDVTPTWTWETGGGAGNGAFRYRLDDSNLTGLSETTDFSFTSSTLTETPNPHILYVQERDAAGNWSASGTYDIVVDITNPSLFPVSFISNNTVTDFAIPGDTIILTFSSSEEITVNGVNFFSTGQIQAADKIQDLGGNDWRVTYGPDSGDPEGTILFSISISDLAGNSPSNITTTTDGTSIIFESSPTTLDVVQIVSDNSEYSNRAAESDRITLTFHSARNLKIPTVTIAGYPADNISSPDENTWTAWYDMDGGAEPEGKVAFSIEFESKTGISGTTVTKTTDNSRVYYDKTDPVLSPISIVSDYATHTNWAKAGSQIKVSFTADCGVENVSATIGSTNQTAAIFNTDGGIGKTWEATYTLLSGQNTDGASVDFSIACQDSSGNAVSGISGTTDGTSVTFDETDPTLNNDISIVSDNATLRTNLAKNGDELTLTFTSSETIEDVAVDFFGYAATDISSLGNLGIDWTITYNLTEALGTYSEGEVPFTIDFNDLAGNSGTQVNQISSTNTVTYDETAPTLGSLTIESNNDNKSAAIVNNEIKVEFIANEPVEGFLNSVTILTKPATVYNIIGNRYGAIYKTQDGDAEGQIPFVINDLTDLAGNVTGAIIQTSTTDNSFVTFDKTDPDLSSISIISSNGDNTKAKVGDIITLHFTAKNNDTLQNVVATINGNATVLTNTDGLVWDATYTMAAGDTPGELGFDITYEDLSGNPGTAYDETEYDEIVGRILSTKVVFDETAPLLTDVNIVSNNAINAFAQIGDVVTLEFTSNEPIINASVDFYGNTVVPVNTGGNTWEATYTMATGNTEAAVAFTITYDDEAGNGGTPGTAIISGADVIFDESVPSLTDINIVSNNANTAFAKIGDVVTLEFTSNEAIINASVDFYGNTVVPVNTGGNTWEATYTMATGNTEAAVAFTITYDDEAGNGGAPGTAIMSGVDVIFDETAPSLTDVNIVSNNANTTLAQIGDVVTLEFTSGVPIINASVDFYGNTVVPVNTGGNTWEATYTMATGNTEAAVAFTITYDDEAGNGGAPGTIKMSGFDVVFDETAPSLTDVNIVSNNANTTLAQIGDVVTLEFTSNEAIINASVDFYGNTVVPVNTGGNTWEATYTMATGNTEAAVAFTITYDDEAGNGGAPGTIKMSGFDIVFDETAPSLTDVNIVSNNANNAFAQIGDVVTLEFTSNEPIINASVDFYGNTIVPINTNTVDNIWEATYTMATGNTEAAVAFTITYDDEAGNGGTPGTAIISGADVIFDESVPSLTDVNIVSNNANTAFAKIGDVVTLEFTSNEAIINASVDFYGNTVVPANTGGNTWEATYTMATGNTAAAVAFTITYDDEAGNGGTLGTAIMSGVDVIFDESKPSLSNISFVSINTNDDSKGKPGDIITLSFTGSEKLENVLVKIAGTTVIPEEGLNNNWSATYTLSSANTEGNIGYTIDFDDMADNEGVQVTDGGSGIDFNKTAPELTDISLASNNIADTTYAKEGDIVHVWFATNEAIKTPIVKINNTNATVTGGPINWFASRTFTAGDTEGNVTFKIDYVDLYDIAGVIGTSTTNITSVIYDKTAPVINAVTVPSGVYKIGDVVSVLIETDGDNYEGQTVEINSITESLDNNFDDTYTVNYTILDTHDELSGTTLPVNIVLVDEAGNTASATSAIVTGGDGNITVDAVSLQINSVTSDAVAVDTLIIGDQITFTVDIDVTEDNLIVSPDTYNGVALSWITTNGGDTYEATYTVSEGDVENVTPLPLGNVTVSDQAGNVSNTINNAAIQKSILSTRPTATILGTTTKCHYGQTVPVTFNLTGVSPYELTYNNGTADFGPFTVNSDTYEIQVEDGTYTLVNLVDATGNNSITAIQDAVITDHIVATVNFNITASPYNVDNDPDDLSAYVDLGPGKFWGPGVTTDGFFYPNVAGAGLDGLTHEIGYAYTDANDCIDTVYFNVDVSNDAGYISSLESVYCNYEELDTIIGVRSGDVNINPYGNFELPNTDNAAFMDNGKDTLFINPTLMLAGNHTIRFKYADGSTNYTIERTFKVDSVSTLVDMTGLDQDKYCASDEALEIRLSNPYPSGGIYYFEGPSAGFVKYADYAVFQPGNAVQDADHSIEGAYISENGCSSDTIRKTIRLNSLPDVSFTLRENYNIDEDTVLLKGIPTGGKFTANFSEIIINNGKVLDPNRYTGAEDDNIILTYTYTDPLTGCANTTQETSRILSAEELITNLQSDYCYDDLEIDISCIPDEDPLIIGEFVSKKGALVDNGDNTAKYSIVDAGDGIDTVFFRYNIGDTPYEVIKEVNIDSIADVTISTLKNSYCVDDDAFKIYGIQEYSRSGGIGEFIYNGTQSAFTKNASSADFNPSLESDGSYTIQYIYTSNAGKCVKDTTYNLDVHNLPELSFNLKESYNLDGNKEDLIGNEPEGIFNGVGVYVDENYYFDPQRAGLGEKTISYSYTDENSCSNTIEKSTTVFIADAFFTGNLGDSIFCLYDDPIIIVGKANDGIDSTGFIVGEGIEIIDEERKDSVRFYPNLAGAGWHTLVYHYKRKDDNAETNVAIDLLVDSIGEISINFENPNEDGNFCSDESAINLEPKFDFVEPDTVEFTGVFSGSAAIFGNEFDPAKALIGANNIVYTYTRINSGCIKKVNRDLMVYDIPDVKFSVEIACVNLMEDTDEDAVVFINDTESGDDEIIRYKWDFGTGQSADTSALETPVFDYTEAGLKEVSLYAETDQHCNNTTTSNINVGVLPVANFTWDKECLTESDITFTGEDISELPIKEYTWEVGGVSESSEINMFKHHFDSYGLKDITLIIKTKDNECIDTLTRTINIQPVVVLSELEDNIYFENFEGEFVADYWQARTYSDSTFISWELGIPSGDSINTASSGNRSWYTNLLYDEAAYQNGRFEQSEVISPCFDISSLERPMIVFNIAREFKTDENGAAIQYSLDEGLTWLNVGAINGGINWMNTNPVYSEPGDQLVGWSQEGFLPWSSARHDLDIVKGKNNIRFRIAFATDGDYNKKFDGFAFDDIWIGDRSKNILNEYFTNNTLSSVISANNSMHSLEESKELDVNSIHYHTGNPAGDALFNDYQNGPSSRVFMYGISAVPYAIFDGVNSFSSFSAISSTSKVEVNSLVDPLFTIHMNADEVDGTAAITVDVQSNEIVENDNLVLFLAVTEKEIASITGENGESRFYNVLKAFIPNTGGTNLPDTWTNGQSETFDLSWVPHGFYHDAETRFIAYVQDMETYEVYQSQRFDLSILTGIDEEISENHLLIYPNPTLDIVNIEYPSIMDRVELYDISGRLLQNVQIDNTKARLNIESYKNGVFLLKIYTDERIITKKITKY